MTEPKRIRLGVVGFGEWGPNHVRNFSNFPETQVVAVADAREERRTEARRRFPEISIFDDHRRLIERATVDAVVVAVPTSRHTQVVRDALKSGLHVLCEKPLCTRWEEAVALKNLARRQRRHLMVGHVFLFNNGIRRLKELIDHRSLGSVQYMVCRRTNLGPIRNDVNVAWDLASHDVAIAQFLLKEMPQRVSAVGQDYLQKGKQDIVFATLGYRKGVQVHIHASWLDPVKVRDITLVGDKKMATWDDLASLGPVRIYDKGVMNARSYADFGQFHLLTREGEVTIPRIPMQEPLRNQAAHFLNVIRGKEACLSDAAMGADVVRVLAAIDRSMKTGGAPVRP